MGDNTKLDKQENRVVLIEWHISEIKNSMMTMNIADETNANAEYHLFSNIISSAKQLAEEILADK